MSKWIEDSFFVCVILRRKDSIAYFIKGEYSYLRTST